MTLTFYYTYEKGFRIKVFKMIFGLNIKGKIQALINHVILKRELSAYCYCSICGNMDF